MTDETKFSVVHRTGPLTVADYDEAITDLLAAKHALQRGESGGCDVCGSDEHWPSECDHNPLRLARKWSASQSVYRCFHCGYEARNEEEAVGHFGRTEMVEPACRRPYRSVDASGDDHAAEAVGWKWIDELAIAEVEKGEPETLHIESPPLAGDGRAIALYRGTKLLAVATIFRDPMNYSVLVRWVSAVEQGA